MAMLATACTKDDAVSGGNDSLVSFTIDSPELATRYGEGTTATNLEWAFYDENGEKLNAISGSINNFSGVHTFDVSLVEGRQYTALFWASAPNAPYTVDWAGKTMTIDNTNLTANNEAYDAFYNYSPIDPTRKTHKIELTRPFAQINFGTLDTELAKVAGFDITVPEAKTTVTTRAYNTLYLGYNQHGTVGGAQDVQVTFSDAALPNEDLYLLNDTAHTTPYDWLSMNYILVPESESSLSECTLVVKDNKGQSVEVKYPSAPVKRNWRTNLVGNLLTDQVVIEVEILPIPEGEYNNEGTFASQLAAGGSILLKSNVVLDDNGHL